MKNIIYAYKKIKEDVIVYVGQTTNLHYRQLQHEKYDPYNPNNREYHLPLSRGIRKYGLDAYQCVVLEEVENQETTLSKQEENIVPSRDVFFVNLADKNREIWLDIAEKLKKMMNT